MISIMELLSPLTTKLLHMLLIYVQFCNPKPEPEDAVTNGMKLLGEKFVDRISSPMLSIRADDEE